MRQKFNNRLHFFHSEKGSLSEIKVKKLVGYQGWIFIIFKSFGLVEGKATAIVEVEAGLKNSLYSVLFLKVKEAEHISTLLGDCSTRENLELVLFCVIQLQLASHLSDILVEGSLIIR